MIAGVAAILASCSKTETVERPETAGIRFDGAYIGYSTETRAFTEIDDLSEFWVYGQYTKDDASTVTVFTNDKVTEGGGENVWTYEGGQRPWIDGATYTFAAYAPENAVSAEGLNDNGYLTFTYTSDQNNQEDLLYAAYTQNGQAESNEPIALIFKHLLSNVQFTFKNGFDKTSEVNVSDIQVTGIATQATFTGNTITGTGDENFEATGTRRQEMVLSLLQISCRSRPRAVATESSSFLSLSERSALPSMWRSRIKTAKLLPPRTKFRSIFQTRRPQRGRKAIVITTSPRSRLRASIWNISSSKSRVSTNGRRVRMM